MANGTKLNHAAGAPDLREKLVGMFADIFLIEIDSDADDLKREEIESWDSVNHLRLVSEIEAIFEIALSDEEVTSFASLRDVESLLVSRGVGIFSRE